MINVSSSTRVGGSFSLQFQLSLCVIFALRIIDDSRMVFSQSCTYLDVFLSDSYHSSRRTFLYTSAFVRPSVGICDSESSEYGTKV